MGQDFTARGLEAEEVRRALLPSVGGSELLIILVIILLLFGAKRVPQLGRSLGSGIREFKQGINDANRDEGLKDDEEEDDRQPAAAVSQATVADSEVSKAHKAEATHASEQKP
jgi:sec-independent protein translocase protein TatA